MKDCINALGRKIALFLDNEMQADQEREFIQEIKQSPECCQKLSSEQKFRSFFQSNCMKKRCSDDLKSKIRAMKDNTPPHV